MLDDEVELTGLQRLVAQTTLGALYASTQRNEYAQALGQYQEVGRLLQATDGDGEKRTLQYTEQIIGEVKRWLGDTLIHDIEAKIAASALAPIIGREATNFSEWTVFEEFETAVIYGGVRILERKHEVLSGKTDLDPEGADPLHFVGEIVRRHFGDSLPDPKSLMDAARYVLHMHLSLQGRPRRSLQKPRRARLKQGLSAAERPDMSSICARS